MAVACILGAVLRLGGPGDRSRKVALVRESGLGLGNLF